MSPAIGSAARGEIEAKDQQFRVGGETKALYGGAIHYWRLDRDKWSDILDKVKGMGFTTVSIYIPWEVHETAKGAFDFGSIDPRKDIDAFLTLCELKDFNIVVRPGPQINSGAHLVRISAPPSRRSRTAGAELPGNQGGSRASAAADPRDELCGRQVF